MDENKFIYNLLIKKIPVTFLKIILVIILLEIGLRIDIVKSLSFQDIVNKFSAHQKDNYRIVCLGTSLLMVGNYPFPQQLQDILNRKGLGFTFSVINLASPQNSSSSISENLEYILSTYKPNMVMILMGLSDKENDKISQQKASFLVKHSKILALLKAFREGTFENRGLPRSFLNEDPKYYCDMLVNQITSRIQSGFSLLTKSPVAIKNIFRMKFPVHANIQETAVNLYPEGDKMPASMNSPALVNFGRSYLKKGDFVKAEEYFKKALALDARNAQTYTNLGRLYERTGKYSLAENMFNKAIELNPGKSSGYRDLGNFYLEYGNFPKAEISLKKALTLDARNTDTYAALGRLYERTGKYSRAENMFNKAIELNPGKSSGYRDLGNFYLDYDNFSKAETSLKKALALDSRNAQTYTALGWLYNGTGNYSLAENMFKKAIEIDPAESSGYRGLVDFYLKSDNFLKSKELLKKIEKSFNRAPHNESDFILPGKLYYKTGNYLKAEEMFKKALEINPSDYKTCLDLGKLFISTGNYLQAEIFLKKAKELSPGQEYVNRVLNDFYLFRRNERILLKNISANPNNTDNYLALGQVYQNSDIGIGGYFLRAEHIGNDALKINPDDIRIYQFLSDLYLMRQDYYQALKFIDKIILKDPRNPVTYRMAANAYSGLDNFKKAENMFTKSVRLNPHDTITYNDFVDFYIKYGKKPAAIKLLKEALRQNTDKTAYFSGILKRLGCRTTADYEDLSQNIVYDAAVINSFHKIKEVLDKKSVRLVCLQYPLRSVEPLKAVFKGENDIVFVDNDAVFKNALIENKYSDLFEDGNHGDFGHFAYKGHKLFAENIAKTLIEEVFKK